MTGGPAVVVEISGAEIVAALERFCGSLESTSPQAQFAQEVIDRLRRSGLEHVTDATGLCRVAQQVMDNLSKGVGVDGRSLSSNPLAGDPDNRYHRMGA